MTKRRGLGEADRTPSEPIRAKSATALNLLSLASEAKSLARAYDQAERGGDEPSMRAVGERLIKLGADMGTAGRGITGTERRRR